MGVRDENAIGIDLELSNYSDLFLLMSLAVLSCDYSDNAKDIFTYLESMNKSDSVIRLEGFISLLFSKKRRGLLLFYCTIIGLIDCFTDLYL